MTYLTSPCTMFQRTEWYARATDARKLMNGIGMKILNEKKEEFKKTTALESKNVQDRDLRSRDARAGNVPLA